jgi:hypothetical protein
MSKEPTNTPTEQGIAPRSDEAVMLRPETSLSPSVFIEESYFRRCWKHTLEQWREHRKLELMWGFVGALIAAVLGVWVASTPETGFVGTALIVVGLAALGFIITLAGIFLTYLMFSPKAIDKKLREEMSRTQLLLETERAKSADDVLNNKIKAVEIEWDKLTPSERKLLSHFSIEGGELTDRQIKFFCEQNGISNWESEGEPSRLYKSSGLLREKHHEDWTKGHMWVIPEALRAAVERVVYRHLDEHGGLSSFVTHGLVEDSWELTQAETKRQAKREYKIERLKELVREGESFGWAPLSGEAGIRIHAYHDKARAFLTEYYDELYAGRFEREGVSVLRALLKELLDS